MSDEKAEAILAVISAIPPGQVLSYGQVAERAGLAGYARHVGKVLGRLPPDSQIPWYRVVRAGNRLAFEEGSRAYFRQRKRLEGEGWVVKGRTLKQPT